MGFTFRKAERLSKRKQIQELFEKGSSFYLYPFKVFLLPQLAPEGHQVLLTVSSRNFKRAVDRNLIKRRMREAYRIQKAKLPQATLIMAFVYTAREILPYRDIQQKMLLAFAQLEKHSRNSIGASQKGEQS